MHKASGRAADSKRIKAAADQMSQPLNRNDQVDRCADHEQLLTTLCTRLKWPCNIVKWKFSLSVARGDGYVEKSGG